MKRLVNIMKIENKDMPIRITNIQRFCLNDGPGIRTVVFLKGCNAHCPWCANPENMLYLRQYYFKKDCCNENLCKNRESCIALNNKEYLLNVEPLSEEYKCARHAIGIYGKDYSASKLLHEILKDEYYMKTGGGVTFSGGEALLQIKELEVLLKQLKEKDIHVAVETALFIKSELLEIALQYVDFFYVDVKILNEKICKEVLGTDVKVFLNNVERLYRMGAEVVFRVPGNRKYTLTENNIELLKGFFQQYPKYKVELFQTHNLAKSKYYSIGKEIWEDNDDTEMYLKQLCEWLNMHNVKASIVTVI